MQSAIDISGGNEYHNRAGEKKSVRRGALQSSRRGSCKYRFNIGQLDLYVTENLTSTLPVFSVSFFADFEISHVTTDFAREIIRKIRSCMSFIPNASARH